jgi:chloride channel 3/4/5
MFADILTTSQLTGEIEYVVPHMIAILVAKWTADFIGGRESVYDLAQAVLGHPFLDQEHAIQLVQAQPYPLLVDELIPPSQTMNEITVNVPKTNCVPRKELQRRLELLKRRGLMDAGLVLVQDGMLQGYIAEGELEFGLHDIGAIYEDDVDVRLLGGSVSLNESAEGDDQQEEELDLSMFVDRTPALISAKAPLEYAVEMFGKLGLRHLCVTEESTGKLVGVVIKKRLVSYLEGLNQ